MLETATYLVTKEIAIRSGLVDSRYRIADGRFVLNNRDLSRVRFEPDEYINGLEGVEKDLDSPKQFRYWFGSRRACRRGTARNGNC